MLSILGPEMEALVVWRESLEGGLLVEECTNERVSDGIVDVDALLRIEHHHFLKQIRQLRHQSGLTSFRKLTQQRMEIVFHCGIANKSLRWLLGELVDINFDERHVRIFFKMLVTKGSFLQELLRKRP